MMTPVSMLRQHQNPYRHGPLHVWTNGTHYGKLMMTRWTVSKITRTGQLYQEPPSNSKSAMAYAPVVGV
jgi:hypothetical protein